MDDQKTMVVSVHAKDCVDYQCRRCGQCCRHIKDSLMVESLDAYRLANYLRGRDPNICTIDDVLTRYCEPMPLTQECFPIFMLKTTGTDDSCIFLKDGLCSIYEARPRTCRIYPFSVGPGERGRDLNTASALTAISSIISPVERSPSKTGFTAISPEWRKSI